MKQASDAILRPEQAAYLDVLHRGGLRALAAIAGVSPVDGRDPLLAKMEARARERRYPISDPEVACLLSVLARMVQPRLVVELGTNIGYGAIVLARAAGPGAKVVTVEYSAEIAAEARAFIAEAGLAARVDLRQGKALDELARIDGPIDLLYVDCVKEEYPGYLALALPRLSERGVVVADNVLWGGEVAQEVPEEGEAKRVAALREFNRVLVGDERLCGVVLPIGDGVGLAVRV